MWARSTHRHLCCGYATEQGIHIRAGPLNHGSIACMHLPHVRIWWQPTQAQKHARPRQREVTAGGPLQDLARAWRQVDEGMLLALACTLAASKPSAHAKPSKPAAAKIAFPPPPPVRHDPFVFVGCFEDDSEHDAGTDAYREAVARGHMTTAQCALACDETPWFATQGGLCQCITRFATAPKYAQLAAVDAAGCESGGAATRNAIYARRQCAFGFAEVQVASRDKQDLGRSEDGQLQWRADVRLSSWVANGEVTLDWGDLPVEIYSVWNAKFASKDEARHGPRVTLQLSGGRNTQIGFKARGGTFPVVPSLACEGKRQKPPPPPLPPREPAGPGAPPPPSACHGARYALSETGLRTESAFTADVSVGSWSMGGQVIASDCFRLLPIASDGFRWLPIASDCFRLRELDLFRRWVL